MDDINKPVKASGAADKTLNILGSVAGIVGNLLLGPDSNVDFSEPFRLGAAYIKQDKENKALLDVLRGNPHTAPIVEVGQQIGQAGGLPAILSGQPQPNQSTQPLVDSIRKPYIDIHSPDFPSQLAERGLGDLAQKVLFAQAQQKPETEMDSLLKTLQIKKALNEPSWEEKNNQQFKQTLALLGIRDQNTKAGQLLKASANKQLQDEKAVTNLVAKSQKDIDDYDLMLGSTNKLIAKVSSENAWPSKTTALIGKLGPIGQGIAQTIAPDSAALIEQLNTEKLLRKNIIQAIVKATGKAGTDSERNFIIGSEPGSFDTKEGALRFLTENKNSQLYGRYAIVYNKAMAGADATQGLAIAQQLGVEPKQLAAFKRLKAIIDSGKDPATDPAGSKYMELLGMVPIPQVKSDSKNKIPKPKY